MQKKSKKQVKIKILEELSLTKMNVNEHYFQN